MTDTLLPDAVLDLPCAVGRGCSMFGRAQYLLTRWPLVSDEGDLNVVALCQFHLDFNLDALDPDQLYLAEPLTIGLPWRIGFAIRRSDGAPIRVHVRDERLNGGSLVVEGRADAPFLRAAFEHWVERRYPAVQFVRQADDLHYATCVVAVAEPPAWAHDLTRARRRDVLQGYHEATNISALAAFAERLRAMALPDAETVRLYTLLLEAGQETAALCVGVTAFPGATARALAACAQRDRAEGPDALSPLVQVASWYLATMAAEVV